MSRFPVLAVVSVAVLLAGCDMPGLDTGEKQAAAREAEGRAVGAACRHAGRAIEDCYALNKKADKAAIFAGWRDMNDYMRENKIEPVTPVFVAQGPRPSAESKADAARPLETDKAKSRDAKSGS